MVHTTPKVARHRGENHPHPRVEREPRFGGDRIARRSFNLCFACLATLLALCFLPNYWYLTS
uniref:Uncharacterized protein n=1 Tax=Aegilops tauschii subsp. strangulata TaxID=200361 RepID=A0A453JN53_AEGTS